MKNEELQIRLKSSLQDLKNTVDEFASFNRRDKKVMYDIYLSVFTSLIIYLENNSIPSIFKSNELRILLNKIDDEVKSLKNTLICYSDLHLKINQLQSDFDIVEKSTVLYHHLEDIIHAMKVYLGFDQIGKFRSLESMFDQIITNMNAHKINKQQSYRDELLELKNRIHNTESEEMNILIESVDYLLNEFEVSGIINQKKPLQINQRLDVISREARKKSLRKKILTNVRLRLIGEEYKNQNDARLEDFDSELERIKQGANT